MELRLYKTMDSDNVINKTLILIHTINIKMKENVSITNPIIILSKIDNVNYFECNYCFLSEFNRYYFIREIEVLNNNNYRFILECDVLETFKDDILNSDVEIIRRLKNGEYYQTNLKTETIRDIDIYKSNVTLENKKCIILSTIGG